LGDFRHHPLPFHQERPMGQPALPRPQGDKFFKHAVAGAFNFKHKPSPFFIFFKFKKKPWAAVPPRFFLFFFEDA
jgi:hypothetical protein